MNLYAYEKELYDSGVKYIAGVDEVGRGPLNGPVVSACVVLPKDFIPDGLNDSKKLTEKQRNKFYDVIKENALGIGIGIVSPEEIDEINIYELNYNEMSKNEDYNYIIINGSDKDFIKILCKLYLIHYMCI